MSKIELGQIVEKLGADSAAVMMPNDNERYLFCFDSYNMPPEWVAIKNSYDENIPGGNVEVYKTGKAATTNHLRILLEDHYIESVMIIPVKRGDITVAMLEIIHDKDNKTFSPEDQKQAEAFTEKLKFLIP